MSLDATANFIKLTLTTGYDSSATSIVVSSGGSLLPTPSFNMTWWDSTNYPDPSDDPNVEIVRVTGVSGNTLTITRAQEGTSATAKNAVGHTYKILLGITSKMITDIDSQLTGNGPGGSDTQVQFNDNGAFGADPNFLYDPSGDVVIDTGVSSTGGIFLGNGKPSDVIAGAGLSTTDTFGFFFPSNVNGTPTGVPARGNGAMVFDFSSNKLYMYNAGWQNVNKPKSYFVTAANALTGPPTGTNYFGVSGDTTNATESNKQQCIPVGGTVDLMTVRVSSNTYNAPIVFNFRVNGTNAGPTFTIGTGSTGFFTSTGSTAVAAGDLIAIQTTTTGTGVINLIGLTTEFIPS